LATNNNNLIRKLEQNGGRCTPGLLHTDLAEMDAANSEKLLTTTRNWHSTDGVCSLSSLPRMLYRSSGDSTGCGITAADPMVSRHNTLPSRVRLSETQSTHVDWTHRTHARISSSYQRVKYIAVYVKWQRQRRWL